MKHGTRLLLALTFFFCANAQAGTQALGFEIGVSTVEQISDSLSKQANVEDTGINKYSQGPMLKTDGNSYEIDGLNSVVYIFDRQNKLAGILMDMNKNRFDAVFKALSGKYKVSTQKRPFVGDQFARFKTKDTIIEIDAPHLSFEMQVRYIRNDLMQKFNTQSAREAEEKKKREAEKF
jgi:hypothetical protein